MKLATLALAVIGIEATIHRVALLSFSRANQNSDFSKDKQNESCDWAPREAKNDDFDGSFPSTITSRRSIFDIPRIKQGLTPDLLRKYKHMESMIQFYDQSLSNITKYWTYGCWCFQMGDYPLRIGNGQPVDNVDKICKKQKECYRCAKKDAKVQHSKECYPEETRYKFKAMTDPVTKKNYVECKNAVGTCERNICECDKAFASKLPAAASDPEEGWTDAHHAHYGGFDSRNQCMRKMGPGGNDKELVCCGEYPERYMYRVNKDDSGKQCCGNKIFDTDTHTCCDNSVVSHGSC